MKLAVAKTVRLSIVVSLVAAISTVGARAQEFTVDFNDQNATQVGSIQDIEPPLTIGHATFSGGGLVREANGCPENPTPMYSITNPDTACQLPDGTPCQTQGCNTCLDTILVQFDVAVEFVTFEIHGGLKVDSSYRVTDDAGHEETVFVAAGSVTTVELPFDGLREIRVTYASTTASGGWKVLVDNFRYYQTAVVLDIAEADHVKVLTLRSIGTDGGYPSPHQTSDGAIEIKGTVMGAPQSVAARTVYLRVIDPPDTAPYVPAADRRANDNREPLERFERLPSQVTTDADGKFTATLRTTMQHAGDNYRVEASVDPELVSNADYSCDSRCARSGTITAWKRVYVEEDRMFRAGAFLAAHLIPCTNSSNCPATVTIAVDDARPLARARTLHLMHAPRADGLGGNEFYSEDVAVVGVDRKKNTVEISMPARPYYGPETESTDAELQRILADAVGVVDDPEDTFYQLNTSYVRDHFAAAFVEYVWDDRDPVPYVPYVPIVRGFTASDPLGALARKWFYAYGTDNVQHLLAGARGEQATNEVFLGLTTSRIGTNFSWIFVEAVNSEAPRRGRLRFNGEVVAHELTHEWQVNPTGDGGHCVSRRYDVPGLFCSMYGSYNDFGNCKGTCPEFYDGEVALHYDAGADSEYLYVRRRIDQFPQTAASQAARNDARSR